MRRREFIALLGGGCGGVAAGGARAAASDAGDRVVEQSSLAPGDQSHIMAAFNQGLNETGYFEGRNVAFEFRWASGQFDRLPALAADLVRRQVTLIAAISGTPSALAAKSATSNIPIVFAMGSDPVTSRAGYQSESAGAQCHRRDLLHGRIGGKAVLGTLLEMVPKATTIAVFANPKNPPSDLERTNVHAAALAVGQQAVFTMSALKTISMSRLLLSQNRPLARFTLAPILCSSASETNSSRLRHAETCRRSIQIASMPKLAG